VNIIESIYHEPEAWKQTEYTMRHSSGLEIWTKNGRTSYAPYPGGIWPWRMKRRFHKARLWWHENRPASRLQIEFKGIPA